MNNRALPARSFPAALRTISIDLHHSGQAASKRASSGDFNSTAILPCQAGQQPALTACLTGPPSTLVSFVRALPFAFCLDCGIINLQFI